MKTYLLSLSAERQKTRHSTATWFVWVGGLFVPFILLLVQTFYPDQFSPNALGEHYWNSLFKRNWQSMSVLLVPCGIVMATALVMQLEHRNHSWKQVYAAPQSLWVLFAAKWSTVMSLMLQFFVIHFIGMLLVAYLPGCWSSAGFPPFPPIDKLLYFTGQFFIASLPLFAFQFFMAMRFRNILVSIGVGMAMVLASIFAMSWEYSYAWPFCHLALTYAEITGEIVLQTQVPLWAMSLLWFGGISLLHLLLYLAQKERG